MKILISGLLIAITSFIALACADVNSTIQALIALPGSAGLLIALWDVIKSSIEQKNRMEEKSAEQSFMLSATSHMAEKAFDKHVEFCEKYVEKANEGLVVLFSKGPTEDALKIASELYAIRRIYILWETSDVTLFLDKFEKALREMGATEHFINFSNLPVGPQRTQLVEKIFKIFTDVVNIDKLPNDATPEIAVAHIIDRLRDHLGILELTRLRKFYLSEAVKRLK